MRYFYAENAECLVLLQGDSSAALKSNSSISQALYIEIATIELPRFSAHSWNSRRLFVGLVRTRKILLGQLKGHELPPE